MAVELAITTVAVAMAVLGVLHSFFGYKINKVTSALGGLAFGAVLGVCAGLAADMVIVAVIASIVLGIVFAVFSAVFRRFGTFASTTAQVFLCVFTAFMVINAYQPSASVSDDPKASITEDAEETVSRARTEKKDDDSAKKEESSKKDDKADKDSKDKTDGSSADLVGKLKKLEMLNFLKALWKLGGTARNWAYIAAAAGLVAGIFSIVLPKPVTIFSTSLSGGGLAAFSSIMFFGVENKIVLCAIVGVFFIAGMIVQIVTGGKAPKKAAAAVAAPAVFDGASGGFAPDNADGFGGYDPQSVPAPSPVFDNAYGGMDYSAEPAPVPETPLMGYDAVPAPAPVPAPAFEKAPAESAPAPYVPAHSAPMGGYVPDPVPAAAPYTPAHSMNPAPVNPVNNSGFTPVGGFNTENGYTTNVGALPNVAPDPAPYSPVPPMGMPAPAPMGGNGYAPNPNPAPMPAPAPMGGNGYAPNPNPAPMSAPAPMGGNGYAPNLNPAPMPAPAPGNNNNDDGFGFMRPTDI